MSDFVAHLGPSRMSAFPSLPASERTSSVIEQQDVAVVDQLEIAVAGPAHRKRMRIARQCAAGRSERAVVAGRIARLAGGRLVDRVAPLGARIDERARVHAGGESRHRGHDQHGAAEMFHELLDVGTNGCRGKDDFPEGSTGEMRCADLSRAPPCPKPETARALEDREGPWTRTGPGWFCGPPPP